jgi:uncharacterized protein involved in exopolysaccharide biosynthesis
MVNKMSAFVDYLRILKRHVFSLALICLLGVGSSAYVLFNLIDPVYQASSSLLILEQRGNGISGLVSQLETELESMGPLRGLALQGINNKSISQDLISILKSRSLAETVNRQINLKSLKELQISLKEAPPGQEQRIAVEYLQKHTKILPPDSQDGTLRIRIRLADPELSAQIANLYVKELSLYVGSLLNRDQNKQLIYLESQLAKLKKELENAESALLGFQQAHQTLALDEEVKQLIVQIAELEAQEVTALAALQDARARQQQLDKSANELDPNSSQARTQIDLDVVGLQERQQTLKAARQRYQQMILRLPSAALSLARLERQVKFKTQLYLLLQQQTQASQLDAARKIELFRILDPAIKPLKPIYPVKSIWLGISALLSLFLGILLILVYDFMHRLNTLPIQRTEIHQVSEVPLVSSTEL